MKFITFGLITLVGSIHYCFDIKKLILMINILFTPHMHCEQIPIVDFVLPAICIGNNLINLHFIKFH